MTHLRLLVLTIALTTTFSGCGYLQKQIVLHPIEKSDIVSMEKGIAYTPEKNGWFLSDYTMQEVENAKVEQAKR